MSKPASIMIFAAGLGTRMGTLTETRPKPMIEVAGRPLIEHALDLCAAFETRVANTHYLPGKIEPLLRAHGVLVSREDVLLDTGGGLKAALPLLEGESIATLNADAVWAGPNPFPVLEEAWDPDRMDALLAIVPAERAFGRAGAGDFSISAEGQLRRGGTAVYTGAQIVRRDVVASVDEDVFSLNRIWDASIANGRLFGVCWQGSWADVGHPGGIVEAGNMLAAARHV